MPARPVTIVALIAGCALAIGRAEAPNPALTPAALPILKELLLAGKIHEASRRASVLAAANPGDAAVHALLGDVLFRQSRFAEAEDAYRTAASTGKSSARGHWGLGRVAQLKGQTEVARHHFSAAFQRDPRDPDIVLSFADVVRDDQSRAVLLSNFVRLAANIDGNVRTLGDAAAKLEIAQRVEPKRLTRLLSPAESYDIKLEGYFPNGSRRSGVMLLMRLNGSRPLRMLVDSGADGILVHQRAVRKLGLEHMVDASISGVGSAGGVLGEVSLAKSVSVGAVTWENCLVRVTPEPVVPAADGVIGMNMFRDFLVQMDFRQQVLRLRPFPQEEIRGAGNAGMTPFYRVQHFLLVPTMVNGKDKGYFMVDTGSSFGAVVSRDAAWQLQPREVAVQGAAGLADDAFGASPVRLAVGAREWLEPSPVAMDLAGISQMQGVEIGGIIGYPLLQNLVLTINYRDGLIDFEDRKRTR